MKIEELSIGDWVQDSNGIIAKVRGIENWDDGYILNVQTVSGSICALSATGALPIPLTPEILEKNGFVRKDKYRFVNIDMLSTVEKYGNKYYDYHNIYKKGKTYRPIRVGADNIKYVHELQHAMKLAGIEKEIEV
jgi:hypothetical protein